MATQRVGDWLLASAYWRVSWHLGTEGARRRRTAEIRNDLRSANYKMPARRTVRLALSLPIPMRQTVNVYTVRRPKPGVRSVTRLVARCGPARGGLALGVVGVISWVI